MWCLPCGASFTPQPRRNGVDPSDGDIEPSIGAHLFTSKFQDEIAVDILAEGQSHVHEADMVVTIGVGVLDGVPIGDGVGVEWGKALAL